MNKFFIIMLLLATHAITTQVLTAQAPALKKATVKCSPPNSQNPLVLNCPFTLSDEEKKEIIENRTYFLKTLKEHVKISGGSQQKWFDLRCANLSCTFLATRFLQFINFSGANLDDSDGNNARFANVNFSGTSLKNINVNNAEFWDVIFDKANVSGADFSSGQLLGTKKPVPARNANFSNINGSAVAMFKNIDFSGAILDGAHFDTSEFRKIIINDKTSFKKTSFVSAILGEITGMPENKTPSAGSRSRTDSNTKNFLLEQKANLTNATIDGLDTDIPVH